MHRTASSTMAWVLAGLFLAPSACLRAGLEARPDARPDGAAPDGAPSDGGTDGDVEPSAFTEVPLPLGGHFERIAFSEASTSRYYLLASCGDLYHSGDRGGHWARCSRRAAGTAFAVDLEDPDTVLLATEDDVMVSHDGCSNWARTHLDARATVLHPSTAGALAATVEGLHRLADDGWHRIETPLDAERITSIEADADGQHLFIGSAAGSVARSDDAGVTWALAAPLYAAAAVIDLAVDPTDGERLFAQTGHGLGISSTGGAAWGTTYDWGRLTVALDPGNPRYVVASGWDFVHAGNETELPTSPDRRSPNMDLASAQDLLFDPEVPQRLLAATTRGFFIVNDRSYSWSESDAGLSSWSVVSMARDQDSGRLYLATPGGVLRSDDGGETWQVKPPRFMDGLGSAATNGVLVDGPGRLFACGRNLVLSTDAGASWTAALTIGEEDLWTVNFALSRDDLMVVGTGCRVGLSEDGGASWELRQVAAAARSVRDAVLLAEAPSQALMVATSSGVFWSPDGGRSFEARYGGLSGLNAYALARLPDGTLFVGTEDGLYVSSDVGVSWLSTEVSGSLVKDVLVIGGVVLAAADDGLYASTDGGGSWTRLPGLESAHPRSLGDLGDGSFLVGTFAGGGLYRGQVPEG